MAIQKQPSRISEMCVLEHVYLILTSHREKQVSESPEDID